MPELSDYERAEADKVRQRREQERERAARARNWVPKNVVDAGAEAFRRVKELPVAGQAIDLAADGYERAMKGLAIALEKTGRGTLNEKRIRARFGRHGYPVERIRHIREIDLEVIDDVRPQSLVHRYSLSAAGEGAVSGFLMGGGTILAAGGGVFGAGAGAAPGIGVVAGTFAADTATVLIATSRLIAHTGMYYGYDPRDEFEQLFAAAVLNFGTAATGAAKNAAYADLFRLTRMLATSKSWVELNKSALSKLLQPVFKALSLRLTKMKLGQIVPVAGIVLGAGLNYATLNHVGDVAHWAYRERFLRDKGFVFDDPPEHWAVDSDDPSDDTISIVQLAEEEGIDLPDEPK